MTDITLPSVLQAKALIAPYVRKTPLIACPILERVFLKCEYLQETHSFKVRGAFNALLHLNEEEKRRGVISRSSGNFSQALSCAGQMLHIPVTIVMPIDAPEIKKENTARFGPRLLFQEGGRAAEDLAVARIAKEEQLTVLSPFDHRHVIEGAGTIALEIAEQLPSLTTFVCQIGGGGLIAGTSLVFKSLNHSTHIIGIESNRTKTIADGMRAPKVGAIALPLLQKNVDLIVLATDEQIIAAMRFLYEEMGLMIEPSGAASFAAVLSSSAPMQGDTVCVLSGSNVDPKMFFQWVK